MSTPFNFSKDNDSENSQEPEKTRDYSQGLFGNYDDQQDGNEKDYGTSEDSASVGYGLKDTKPNNDNGQNRRNEFQDMSFDNNAPHLNSSNMWNHYQDKYSQPTYPYQTPYPQKPINSKGLPSNWPDFLIKDSNQRFYGLGSLVAGFATSGIVGIGMSIYYLFILDDSIQKDSLSKVLNWISLIIPVIFYVLIFLGFFLFLLLGATLPNL